MANNDPFGRNSRERKLLLKADLQLAAMPCHKEALRHGLEVLCSNTFGIVALIVIKGIRADSADALFMTDYYLCTEICVDAINEVIDIDAKLMDPECLELWKKLTAAFHHFRSEKLNGWPQVCFLLLLACAFYLMDRRLGRPFLPDSHFPQEYLNWLRSLSPPILLAPDASYQDLLRCVSHLEQILGLRLQ